DVYGNDDDPGTSAQPFRTIQRCADLANPGDTCFVRQGTYYELVNVNKSGLSDSSRITFQGARGPSGEYLTTVNGAITPLTSWESAPEIGPSIYKTAKPTYYGPISGQTIGPCNMEVDGYAVWDVKSDSGDNFQSALTNDEKNFGHAAGALFAA